MDIPEKYKNQYNVHDFLKDKTTEEIRSYCQERSAPAAMAMFNVGYDFNVSALIRNCNFFALKEVHHIQKEGKRRDCRGAVGSQHYTECIHSFSEEEFFSKIENKYIPIAIENNILFPSSNMYGFVPPQNAIFIFGAENQGLSDTVLAKCAAVITIPAWGSVRSLNVGCTSAVVAGWYRQFWH